jgi:hypothetical protein
MCAPTLHTNVSRSFLTEAREQLCVMNVDVKLTLVADSREPYVLESKCVQRKFPDVVWGFERV